MPKQFTVSDYYPDAKQPRHAFLKRYSHPFLVVVGWKDENDDEMDAPSYNTQLNIPNMAALAALAEGKILPSSAVVFPLVKRGSITPGASPSAGVIMAGRAENNDVVIHSSRVSKSHFHIAPKPFREDEYTLSDNGSTNGTRINDVQVHASDRIPLKSGDKISVGGEVWLRFYLSSDFWEILQRSFNN